MSGVPSPRRWTLARTDDSAPWFVTTCRPGESSYEMVEVMPVAEHEAYRESAHRILHRYESALKRIESHGAGYAVKLAREALEGDQ